MTSTKPREPGLLREAAQDPEDNRHGKRQGTHQSWIPVLGLGAQPITNDMPRGRAGRDSIEAAVRQALAGLRGHWRARIAPVDACCVEIGSPDGFRCLAFIPNPTRQGGHVVAERLKEACRSLCVPSAHTRWRKVRVLVLEQADLPG